MTKQTAIHIENISKKFHLQHPVKDADGNVLHEIWPLKNLNLEVEKGESIGIVGPNGSGKSTLLKIIAGILKPTSGQVTLHGKLASILDIGAGFHPELSGRDNIFLNGQLLGFSKKEIRSRFEAIVDFSGIEKFIDEPVKNYSAGMYLRLAFSVMAQIDADIYLFDEVLHVGDEEFRMKSNQRLREMIAEGKTTLVVSHDVLLLSTIVNKLLTFPSLEKLELTESFETTAINRVTGDVALKTVHHALENGAHQFTVELQTSLAQEVDIVLVFRSSSRMFPDFAVSSLHPAKMDAQPTAGKSSIRFQTALLENLINPGTYSVTIQVIGNKNTIIRKFPDCLEFQVQPKENPQDKFYNFYPGPIRIISDWNKS